MLPALIMTKITMESAISSDQSVDHKSKSIQSSSIVQIAQHLIYLHQLLSIDPLNRIAQSIIGELHLWSLIIIQTWRLHKEEIASSRQTRAICVSADVILVCLICVHQYIFNIHITRQRDYWSSTRRRRYAYLLKTVQYDATWERFLRDTHHCYKIIKFALRDRRLRRQLLNALVLSVCLDSCI